MNNYQKGALMYKLFVKKDGCPKCKELTNLPPELKTHAGNGIILEVFDVDEKEGLAEASFHGILSTPYLINVDNSDEENVLKEWNDPKEINKVLEEILI
jgi:hypothetical protein